MAHVDVTIEPGAWSAVLPDAEALVHRAARAALDAAPDVPANAELSILLSDDANVRRLNRDYRGTDSATNVLAFANGTAPGGPRGGPVLLGDVVIAFETTAREAEDQNKSLSGHVCHLLVHGALHLLGYGHDEAAAASIMEDLERTILASLGIPDPYAARGPDELPRATVSGAAPNAPAP